MYYKNGEKAEVEFKNLMLSKGRSCVLTSEIKHQYADIDLFLYSRDKTSTKSISVKEQTLADKYSTFLFETVQIRTSDMAYIEGNIHQCQADLYAVCSPTFWFVFDAPKLKQWLKTQSLPEIRTTSATEAKNRKMKGNNCYDRTLCVKATYEALEACPAFLYKTSRKQ